MPAGCYKAHSLPYSPVALSVPKLMGFAGGCQPIDKQSHPIALCLGGRAPLSGLHCTQDMPEELSAHTQYSKRKAPEMAGRRYKIPSGDHPRGPTTLGTPATRLILWTLQLPLLSPPTFTAHPAVGPHKLPGPR